MSRPYRVEISATARSWARSSWPPSMRTREHEVLVVELVRLEHGGAAAVDAGLALGVQAPPAHPPAQVGRVDAGEAAVGVDGLDPGPDVEAVVVLLGALVGVERLAVAERPLALAAGPLLDGRAAGGPACGGFALVTDIVGVLRSGGARTRDRPAPSGRSTAMSDRSGATRAQQNGGRRVSKPDRWRCARGRSRRGDEPRSGGRQRISHDVAMLPRRHARADHEPECPSHGPGVTRHRSPTSRLRPTATAQRFGSERDDHDGLGAAAGPGAHLDRCRAAPRGPACARSAGPAGRPLSRSKSSGRPRPLSATLTCSCRRNRCAEITTSPSVLARRGSRARPR